MSYKKFIASIYIKNNQAVKNYDDLTVLENTPKELVKLYGDLGADEIMIMDLSDSFEAHEESFSLFKELALISEIPVIAAGNVFQIEDAKKYLYAGCHKVCLDFTNPKTIDITEDIAKKFGKENLVGLFNMSEQVLNYKPVVEAYLSELIALNTKCANECQSLVKLPIVAEAEDLPLNSFFSFLNLPGISGVCGSFVNVNINELNSLKALCRENGIMVKALEARYPWSALKKNGDGMVPVVVQDYKTNEVLMVAYMNEESYLNTIRTGKMTYYSRSRQELWLKGDTSGHYQYVKSLTIDCDLDTILAKVSQVGAACHTGARSCFFTEIAKKDYQDKDPYRALENVYKIVEQRRDNPQEGSYTNYLFDKGLDKILKKVGEEATDIVIASKNPDANVLKYEISDFLYHLNILMVEKGVTWDEIMSELTRR